HHAAPPLRWHHWLCGAVWGTALLAGQVVPLVASLGSARRALRRANSHGRDPLACFSRPLRGALTASHPSRPASRRPRRGHCLHGHLCEPHRMCILRRLLAPPPAHTHAAGVVSWPERVRGWLVYRWPGGGHEYVCRHDRALSKRTRPSGDYPRCVCPRTTSDVRGHDVGYGGHVSLARILRRRAGFERTRRHPCPPYSP